MHRDEDEFGPLLAAAERLLLSEFGREVRLGDAERLSEHGRRNILVRSRDLCGGFPASVIIKKVVVDTYNPDDAASWDIRRFFSDWVGAQFLSAMADGPHSPRFYGGDYSPLALCPLRHLRDYRSGNRVFAVGKCREPDLRPVRSRLLLLPRPASQRRLRARPSCGKTCLFTPSVTLVDARRAQQGDSGA